MTDLKVDDSGLVFAGGDLVLTSPGLEDIAQSVLVTLSTHRGEWSLDITLGVPWREEVLGKGRDLRQIELLIRGIVEAVPGVVRVERVTATLNRSTRALAIDLVALVETGDGQETLTGTIADGPGFLSWTNGPLGGF